MKLKIRRWLFFIQFIPFFRTNPHWLYRWDLHIKPLYLYANDLSGELIFLNISIRWSKTFK